MTPTKAASMNFKISTPEFLAEPAETLARMREAGPLVQVKVPVIGPTWITTTDAAARALLKDPRFARNPRGPTGRSLRQILWFLPGFLKPMLDNIIVQDGAEHRRLRGFVDKAFARVAIDQLIPEIEAI